MEYLQLGCFKSLYLFVFTCEGGRCWWRRVVVDGGDDGEGRLLVRNGVEMVVVFHAEEED